LIELRRRRLDVAEIVDSVRRDDAGAVVAFVGTVRADPGVGALDYEVYRPLALTTLSDVASKAKAKFGALEVSIVHRVGRIPVGGDSVVVACSAPHRAPAFEACAWAMEEVKRIVPIWKSEPPPRGREKARAPLRRKPTRGR
jgi:molybdopterin synthase catalytic subunit